MSRMMAHMGWRLGVTAAGLLLMLLSVGVFFFGQKHAAGKAASMAKLQEMVVEIDPQNLDSGNDGKLVHLTGTLSSEGVLTDEDTGVSSQGVRLRRKVEMYQWVPGKTSVSVSKGKDKKSKTKSKTEPPSKKWKSKLVTDSLPSGHENPDKMPMEGQDWTAETVMLGKLVVPASSLDGLKSYEVVKLDDGAVKKIEGKLGRKSSLHEGKVHLGEGTPTAPKVGDLRVWYEEVPFAEVSVVGAQKGDTFETFRAEDGTELLLFVSGKQSAADLLGKEAEQAGSMAKIGGVAAIIIFLVGALVFAYGFKNARNQYKLNKAMSSIGKG